MNNLVKINAELSNVKSDLTNKLEGISNYLRIDENCIPKRCAFEQGLKKSWRKPKSTWRKRRQIYLPS
jgi:hypothetical protein